MSESTKHDEIYLQLSDDPDGEWVGEVTWCTDRIHKEDVKYIRADLVESLRQQLATSQHNYTSLETAFNEMKELAGERLKQIAMLRLALETLWSGTNSSEWDGVAIKMFEEALEDPEPK